MIEIDEVCLALMDEMVTRVSLQNSKCANRFFSYDDQEQQKHSLQLLN
jgi:hypothetical protein